MTATDCPMDPQWETVSTVEAPRECEATVHYRIGLEYTGDGECGWSGTATVHTLRNGTLFWECGNGHEHYEGEPA